MRPSHTISEIAEKRWVPVDPLGEALHILRMSGLYYSRSELTAPWGAAVPPLPDSLIFHVVTEGSCWLLVPDEAPQRLMPGEFALVPHGVGYQVLSEVGVTAVDLFDLPLEAVTERYEILRYGGGGAPTTLICGSVRFEHPAAQHLVKLLPPLIHLKSWETPHAEWMQSTLRLMAQEARELRPGGETIVTRLADILVIQALRTWMANAPQAQQGWLGALQDPQIGAALVLMQREPAHSWTVASLAQTVAMSRSAFAARFKELVGESPLQYLTSWRMQLAHSWLQSEDLPLAELAERLGYRSEAAFSRAFKREMGSSPGAMRRGGLSIN